MNDCIIKIQDNDEIIFPTPSEGMNQPTQGKVLYAPNSTHISFELSMRCGSRTELQKRAIRANQLVLFFLAGANFWEKPAKNRRKQAKTGEKQVLFWC